MPTPAKLAVLLVVSPRKLSDADVTQGSASSESGTVRIIEPSAFISVTTTIADVSRQS
jgi:hypothetical protein